MTLPRARWLPLIVAGGWNPELRKAFDRTSGAYAIRNKTTRRVVYVGESNTGRGWKTLTRHFQDRSGKFARVRETFTDSAPQNFEASLWVTSKGARKEGDQKALDAQAELIARFRKEGHELVNRDDGLAAVTALRTSGRDRKLGARAPAEPVRDVSQEEDDYFGSFAENPPPKLVDVPLERRADARTPDLFTGRTRLEEGAKGARRDWKGESERLSRELAACRAAPTTEIVRSDTIEKKTEKITKPAKPEGFGEIDAKGQAGMFKRNPSDAWAASKAAGAATTNARADILHAKAAALHEDAAAAARAAGDSAIAAEHEAASREHARSSSKANDRTRDDYDAKRDENSAMSTILRKASSARNPGGLVKLGDLISLIYHTNGRRRAMRWGARGAPIVAYDPAKGTASLVLVFAPKYAGAGTAKGAKEYKRTHWGQSGEGEKLAGDVLRGKAPYLGTALEITYATRKGADRELVDYHHVFGDYGSLSLKKSFIPPRVVAATLGGRQLVRLEGGTYTVTAHGIVG